MPKVALRKKLQLE